MLINVGRSFKLTPSQLYWKILFPAALPTIFVGVRLGMIFALINIVGVEFLINFGGLGQLVNELAERYDLPGTYAAICFVILVSVLFFIGTERIERWLQTGHLTRRRADAAAVAQPGDAAAHRHPADDAGDLGGGRGVGHPVPRRRAVARGHRPGAGRAAVHPDLKVSCSARLLIPAFYWHLYVTLTRSAIALLIGGIAGLAVGIVLGANPFLARAFERYLYYLGPTPKIVFFPVMIMWFGVGPESKIAMGTLSCFFPIVLSAAAGMRQIEAVLIRVGRSFRAQHLADGRPRSICRRCASRSSTASGSASASP